MSRYIDADALIMALRLEYPMMPMFKENQKEWEIKTDGYRKAEEVIDDAPTIDIVRCKECRYCKRKRGTFKGEPIIFYRCEEHNRDVENDDFCSWAEREGK